MTMTIVLIAVGFFILLGIFLLNTKFFDKVDRRRRYLEELADFLESKLEPIPAQNNSFFIKVTYKDKEFIYEDIEDRLEKTCFYKVYLKVKTSSNLKISFTERPRTSIRANVQSLSDISSPWTVDTEKISLPAKLQDFILFTNDNAKARVLFENDNVVKVFVQFKNMDPMGHPRMSLEIIDGVIVLTFHPPGDLKPTWADLEGNVSLIADYIDQLDSLADTINALKGK